MENKILLTPVEIAIITGGKWDNYNKDINITGVNYYLPYLSSGDLFVTINPEQWSSKSVNNESKHEYFFTKGASAVMVRRDANIKSDKPILRVDNTKKALRDIALATSHFSNAKRVLVTGTEGKTNFKFQLTHMVKEQINTHSQLDSANMDLPIWQNLANIKANNDLVIVEVAVPAANIGPMRSRFVKPDICVITELGFEHMVSHGTIENLIKNKVSVVEGLNRDGICILNGDNQFFNDAKAEVRRLRGDVKIVSFGHDDFNEAQIVSRDFKNNSWDISIKLDDNIFTYNVPFVEEFAPINSLMVLATSYYLNLDVQKSIDTLKSYEPFQTHGGIYHLSNEDISFTLYDQSYRGKYQPFLSFFRTIKNINCDKDGRRILVMSQIVDDRDFDFFDFDEFIPLFKEANIDIVYTVAKFKVHQHIIDEKTQWKKHGESHVDIVDDIIADLKDNDTIFIKGVHASGLYNIAKKLKNMFGVE